MPPITGVARKMVTAPTIWAIVLLVHNWRNARKNDNLGKMGGRVVAENVMM